MFQDVWHVLVQTNFRAYSNPAEFENLEHDFDIQDSGVGSRVGGCLAEDGQACKGPSGSWANHWASYKLLALDVIPHVNCSWAMDSGDG